MKHKLKQLAEWSAEFLELENASWEDEWYLDNTGIVHIFTTEDILHHSDIAPILMHLGQVEMEKRGFEIVHFTWGGHTKYGCRVNGSEKHGHEPHTAYDDNKFIAFWSAVRDALK